MTQKQAIKKIEELIKDEKKFLKKLKAGIMSEMLKKWGGIDTSSGYIKGLEDALKIIRIITNGN